MRYSTHRVAGAVLLAGFMTNPLAAHDLVISEFMAVNSTTLLDEEDDTSDWIEIHNQGFETVDLDSFYLTDDDGDLRKWRFPSVSIEGGGYLLVFASGKDRREAGAELHTNFRLSAASEYLALVAADGSTVVFEYAPRYPRQHPDVSYGIGQDLILDALVPARSPCRVLVPDDDALGSSWTGGEEPFDDSGWTGGETGVGFSTEEPGFAVQTILSSSGVCSLQAAIDVAGVANPADSFSAPADIIDFYNTGGAGHYDNNNPFPGLEVGVDVNNYVVVVLATVTIPSAGQWTFGVNSDDGFRLDIVGHGQSYRIEHPNPRGPGDTLGVLNATEPGDYDLRLLFYECGGGSGLELYAAPGSRSSWSSTFRLVGDTAAGGLAVYSDIGQFGASSGFRGLIETDLEDEMRGSRTSAYVRVPFDVADPAEYESLTLRVKYDDAFIAYLNGVEIARQNAPESATFDSVATVDRPRELASSFQQIDVTDHLGRLRSGGNLLALHGLNDSVDGTDFLLLAELAEITLESRATGFFRTPTPAGANANDMFQFVSDTRFSVDRGFFDEPFEVSLSTGTPGAEIRYTMDATEPTPDNGEVYTRPLRITGTTVLRAAAFRDDLEPTNVDTQTYIFLDDVLRQTGAGLPSTWGGVSADYDMDPDIVNHPVYSQTIRDDLKSIPTISIVMDERDLFDSNRGIYSNSQASGIAWERDGSLEVIVPEGFDLPGGNGGVHINCGVRMHGGVGRSPPVLKHSFRLLFKGRYGATKFNYPLFANSIQLAGGEATDQFDTLVLRSGFNDSWVFGGGSNRTYLSDEFIRDSLLEMGQPNGHGTFVHLYLNGVYWGLYNALERPNAPFAATYMGGSKADWDILNSSEVIDGSKDAWNTAQRLASAGLSTPEAYSEIQEWVDVDNLIHYMLANFYGGNGDWDGHNWYSGRFRAPGAGYKFFSWDAERTLEGTGGSNRTGLANGDKPSGLYAALRQNAEFNLRFGDIAHRHCFNRGALSPARTAERFRFLSDFIYGGMVGESARWGDKGRGEPHTRDDEWLREVNRLFNDYFPRRTDVLLGFLRGARLYPWVEAPSFNRHGGEIDPGFLLVMLATLGTIYYTVDGSDPRLPGGDVSPAALIARSGTGSAPTRTLVASGADVRVLVPQDGELGLDWTAADFDDSGWRAGTTGVGYERGSGYEDLIVTDVEAEMYNVTGTVYLRVPFEVDDPSELVLLTLRMKYDDGFVAYLNGTRVAARNAPGVPQWNSTASGSHADSSSIIFENIDIEEGVGLLRAGTNILAIHGLNTSTSSSDLLMMPQLRATEEGGADEKEEGIAIPINRTTDVKARVFDSGLGEWSALNEATFVVNSSDLRITEIMYHPASSGKDGPWSVDEFEFIELKNIGSEAISLERVRFLIGIQFDFSTGAITSLAPDEHVVVVRNLAAFESLYDTDGMLIAGAYEGRLSNSGEAIGLVDAGGEVILHFRYEDSWHPTTDGMGHSLVITDARLPADQWGEEESWTVSGAVDGSPGFDDGDAVPTGRQRAGDSNQDGSVDISDAVHLLRRLFGALVASPPCDGATLEDGSNLVLLDLNGDQAVNVSDAVHFLDFLFNAGPEPAGGVRCTRFPGCPSICVP